MTAASALVKEIRGELRAVEGRLLGHPYLAAVERGTLPREALARFAGEQYLIIESDLRSVAHLASRFGDRPGSRAYFLDTLAGEQSALGAVVEFGRAVGMDEAALRQYEPLAGAHAYTCYMAWLGMYGSEAEVAAAYLVNFPAWGESCGRMSRALRERYGLSVADVRFFDQFAATPPDFERDSLAVIQDGLDRGAAPARVRRSARLLQGYELLFWDALFGAVESGA
jgi:thiaminase